MTVSPFLVFIFGSWAAAARADLAEIAKRTAARAWWGIISVLLAIAAFVSLFAPQWVHFE